MCDLLRLRRANRRPLSSASQAAAKPFFNRPWENGGRRTHEGGEMDIHPWTKYEIARIRDEERLLRAREASLAREARVSSADEGVEGTQTSWFGWLRRRDVPTQPVPARPRPV